jgi:hypothetical protein
MLIELDVRAPQRSGVSVSVVLDDQEISDDDVVFIGDDHNVAVSSFLIDLFINDFYYANNEVVLQIFQSVLPHLSPGVVPGSVPVTGQIVGTGVDALSVGSSGCHKTSIAKISQAIA